jgi:hypothetical protein
VKLEQLRLLPIARHVFASLPRVPAFGLGGNVAMDLWAKFLDRVSGHSPIGSPPVLLGELIAFAAGLRRVHPRRRVRRYGIPKHVIR